MAANLTRFADHSGSRKGIVPNRSLATGIPLPGLEMDQDQGPLQKGSNESGITYSSEDTTWEQFIAQLVQAANLPSTLDEPAEPIKSGSDCRPDRGKVERNKHSPDLGSTLAGLPMSTSCSKTEEEKTECKDQRPKLSNMEMRVVIEIPHTPRIEATNAEEPEDSRVAERDDAAACSSRAVVATNPSPSTRNSSSRAKTQPKFLESRKSIAKPNHRFGMFGTSSVPGRIASLESRNRSMQLQQHHLVRKSAQKAPRHAASHMNGAVAADNSHNHKNKNKNQGS